MIENDRERVPRMGLPYLPTSEVVDENLAHTDADTLIVSHFRGAAELDPSSAAIDAAMGGALSALLANGDFTGRFGEVAVLYSAGCLIARRIILIGLGSREDFTLEAARRASATAVRRARDLGADHVATAVPAAGASGAPAERLAQATLEGALLGVYCFGGWRGEAARESRIHHVMLVEQDPEKLEGVREGARVARAVTRGVALARDLVNLPANVVNPINLAATAHELSARCGLRVQVGDRAWAEGQGMGAFLAVAQGSRTEPAFIELEHNATRPDLPLVVLVGKGVTFDSGGLSLKNREGMIPMKSDMAGAAAVLGTMQAVAELDLPLRVMGVCPCVENMPDGGAFRPSDVLVAGSGHSIEVLSTDAEGRLALAEALWYVQRFDPAAVIDIGTLTGASAAALGRGVAASLFANDSGLRTRLEAAAEASGERVWHMPLFEEYRKAIESKVADLRNSGGTGAGGGAGLAATFLRVFTDYPWAHVDMASMQMVDSPDVRTYLTPGATGFGVRLLFEFLRS